MYLCLDLSYVFDFVFLPHSSRIYVNAEKEASLVLIWMYFGPTFPTWPLFAEKIRPAAGLRIVTVCIHHKILLFQSIPSPWPKKQFGCHKAFFWWTWQWWSWWWLCLIVRQWWWWSFCAFGSICNLHLHIKAGLLLKSISTMAKRKRKWTPATAFTILCNKTKMLQMEPGPHLLKVLVNPSMCVSATICIWLKS